MQHVLGEHGWDVDTPADLDSWCRQVGPRMLLVLLADGNQIERIAHLTDYDDVIVVALLHDAIAEDQVALVRAGATMVLDAHDEPETIAHRVDAINDGHALMPLGSLHRLVAIARSEAEQPALAEEEATWLTLLAEGHTIKEMAHVGHLSERGVHRALRCLYQRIGVPNRERAIVWATRHGIVD